MNAEQGISNNEIKLLEFCSFSSFKTSLFEIPCSAFDIFIKKLEICQYKN